MQTKKNDIIHSNTHEKLFVESFIVNSKKKRIYEFLISSKNRKKVLRELPHFSDLDNKYLLNIPPDMQTSENIYSMLKDKGAPEICYIISIDKEYDKKYKYLKEALDEIVGYVNGCLISCIPGKLGYYEGEDRGARYILERNKE